MKKIKKKSRWYDIQGYRGRFIYYSDGTRKTSLHHREVMEEYLARSLESNEVVHHLDGDKLNNELSNLQLMTRSSHSSGHSGEPEYWTLVCLQCQKSFVRKARIERDKKRRRKRGPFCSKKCAGSAQQRRSFPIKHGKRSGYKRGCRCDACKAAHALYMRQQRQRKKILPA
jgi:hypothetical protein